MTSSQAEQQVLMVVDDEPSQRNLIGGFFTDLGFRVVEAASAESMLDQLQHEAPNMILLDVRLPEMSGIDALPRIRQQFPTIPVILITAYADLRQAVAYQAELRHSQPGLALTSYAAVLLAIRPCGKPQGYSSEGE